MRKLSIVLVLSLLWGINFVTYRRANATTVKKVLEWYGPEADKRLKPYFKRVKVPYPPSRVTLIGLKEEKKLELWALHKNKWVFIRDYDVLAASGIAGPKMRQGDLQVPEGVYSIPVLNPNSHFHLSLKVNYPNAFERKMAREEKRTGLGGDIFIHGDAVSIGCIAIGDKPIEEVFTLVARIGRGKARVIIVPRDLRKKDFPSKTKYQPKWLPGLYQQLKKELKSYSKS